MDQTTLDLKKFAESFFSNLKAEVSWQGDLLHVAGLPADFEAFFGKKGPYVITFDSASPGELIARGSFLLKSMTSYLDTKGQTALIKLVFEHDYLAAFKKSFSFKGCELTSVSKTSTFIPIYQFSFATILQYLNEKEQVMNSLYVEDGKLIPFNLEEYPHAPGTATEFNPQDIKPSYQLAREVLKERIMPRLNELSTVLSDKLQRETERIEQHYDQQRKERMDVRGRLQEQLATIEKNPLTPVLAQKRDKLLESIKTFDAEDVEKKIASEREFFLKDESFKHSLNVDTKLVSTTVIYYPVHTLTLTIKNKDVARAVTVVYNPLKNSFVKSLACEGCNQEIREILLCSSSHILCTNCIGMCRSCERGICSLCTKKLCLVCARTLCKRCVSRCSICWKDVCKNHTHVNYATGSEGCALCLKPCSHCKAYADKNHLQKSADGSDVCLKCVRLADFNTLRTS